ncbi:TGB1 [Sweet potato C6 virus]|uniref:TGB1 n=1 Tax=Sweet potato C6 virus TaxID=1307958 RepID=J7GLW0_9VIRU|nr:TGB1 [Sweet potato C6 virus]AFP73389.1 TGB1 [Sweet potato C6 virus]AGH32541.1 triple gene block protein 1 [Sweet potato C6 virus]
MDVIVKKLRSRGFTFNKPIEGSFLVVNCVPGAGKSSLIRELIEEDSRFEAFTFGHPDKPNVTNCFIKSSDEIRSRQFAIVDEYTEGDFRKFDPIAIFGDPCQSTAFKEPNLICNYFSTRTFRFGKATAALLRSLGFNIWADKEDTVEIGHIFEREPEGQIVCYEPEIQRLVERHSGFALTVEDIRGITEDVVTFITSETKFDNKHSALIYLCLTRHMSKLLILTPDGSYTSS